MNIQSVIIRPIISEKSMGNAGKGEYTFAVKQYANKKNIKKAIEDAFHVHVTQVATSNVKGKKKRVGMRRNEVAQQEWKRAIITLEKGQKIDIFEAGS